MRHPLGCRLLKSPGSQRLACCGGREATGRGAADRGQEEGEDGDWGKTTPHVADLSSWHRPGRMWKGQSQELGSLVLVPMGRAQGGERAGVEMPPLLSTSRERGLLRPLRGLWNMWAGRPAAIMSPSTRGLGVPCPAAGNQTFTKLTQFFSIPRAVRECLSVGPAPRRSPGWETRLTCPERELCNVP